MELYKDVWFWGYLVMMALYLYEVMVVSPAKDYTIRKLERSNTEEAMRYTHILAEILKKSMQVNSKPTLYTTKCDLCGTPFKHNNPYGPEHVPCPNCGKVFD